MGSPRLLDLGEAQSQDARLAGAKAAMLARARAAGLPALPGCVVPVAAGQLASRQGAAALAGGGSGRARLAVMAHDVDADLLGELTEQVRRLGPPVVVRSSSVVEDGVEWAGAFSSFDGVGVEELSTALRGVWASAFSVDALERCAAMGVDVGTVGLAVLVQPELAPECGGSARLRADGTVELVAVPGGPRGLLSGHERGVRATVSAAGTREGPALEAFGSGVVDAVASLSRRVAEVLHVDLIEWAWAQGRIALLQATQAAAAEAPQPSLAWHPALGTPAAARVASLVRRYPGPLGEALVLPWALGVVDPSALESVPASQRIEAATPSELLGRATVLASSLASTAWGVPPEQAASLATSLFRDLRGPHPDAALSRLPTLHAVDPTVGASVVAALVDVAVAAVASAAVPSTDEAWQHTPQELLRILTQQSASPRVRIGPDRWEPFLTQVVGSQGEPTRATPAAPGLGAGALAYVGDVRARLPVGNRRVVVAPRPIAALASLLWGAAGLVTGPGDAGAHLFEVATSLGVPAVVDADLPALFGDGVGPDELVLAVDGTGGQVWSLRL